MDEAVEAKKISRRDFLKGAGVTAGALLAGKEGFDIVRILVEKGEVAHVHSSEFSYALMPFPSAGRTSGLAILNDIHMRTEGIGIHGSPSTLIYAEEVKEGPLKGSVSSFQIDEVPGGGLVSLYPGTLYPPEGGKFYEGKGYTIHLQEEWATGATVVQVEVTWPVKGGGEGGKGLAFIGTDLQKLFPPTENKGLRTATIFVLDKNTDAHRELAERLSKDGKDFNVLIAPTAGKITVAKTNVAAGFEPGGRMVFKPQQGNMESREVFHT